MKKRKSRILPWLMLIGTGGTLFQYGTTGTTGTTNTTGTNGGTDFPITGTGGAGGFGCQRFATNAVGGAVDWCYVLDCENGFFGGVIDPCNDPSMGPWLLDCPNAGETTTDTTDTTNGTSDTTDTQNQSDTSGG